MKKINQLLEVKGPGLLKDKWSLQSDLEAFTGKDTHKARKYQATTGSERFLSIFLKENAGNTFLTLVLEEEMKAIQ